MAKLEACPHPRCDHRNPVGTKHCGRCKRLFADNPLWLNVLAGVLVCIALLWGTTGD
jgi:hypothetical protein